MHGSSPIDGECGNAEELLQAFLPTLAGKAPKTITAYQTTLRSFVAWMATMPRGAPFRMELLTTTAITGYLAALKALGRAPRTQAKALAALHRFCRWAQEEGLLRRNPVTQIARPTVTALAPTELSPQTRYILATLVERTDSPRLYVSSLHWRIGQITHQRSGDPTNETLSGQSAIRDDYDCRCKRGKTRTLDLHNAARRALYTYLYENAHAADARDPASAYVFTGQRAAWLRQQGRPDHLSPRAIEHLWARLKQSATHAEWAALADVTFHDLRHDFAHRARQSGWLLEELAAYLGHQTTDGAPAIQTTARYTLPSRHQLKQRLQQMPE